VTTIRDVAQLAGVSTMTVSRVINRSGYASDAARRRVDGAIAELGFVEPSVELRVPVPDEEPDGR
jgi:DNA-binding LacI/PurR family transcriptional regulator